MTLLQLGSTSLLLAGMFVFRECDQATLTSKTHEVDITNCSAPQVDVKHKDKVHWNSKDAGTEYTIDFSSNEPTPSPFNVTGSLSPAHQIKGHAKCRTNTATNGCWYKYTLTRVGESKPCGDPIIHIEP
jgi:hypothetical protein